MSGFLTPLDVRLIKDDRSPVWELRADFHYQSDIGGRIVVPKGFRTDFASVPRLPFIYDFLGDMAREPATVHDWLYTQLMWGDREKCDRILREAMEAEGLEHRDAEAFYLGVQAGGEFWWDNHKVMLHPTTAQGGLPLEAANPAMGMV